MVKKLSTTCGQDATSISPIQVSLQSPSGDRGLNLQVSRNALPCAGCGSKERKIGEGSGPHFASLRCGECDRFIKWIGKSELAKLNQGGQV